MIVHKPNYKHWKEVDRVLRYLEVIMNHGLHFFGIGSTSVMQIGLLIR